MSRPPLLARLLLRALVPAQLRDAFAGDLEERFRRDAERDLRGARRTYWKDVLSPTVLHLRREMRGMPLPPGSPARAGLHRALGDGIMTALTTDLKFAFRMMRKAPAFTAVAVLSLALGIGPNTAIFSVVDAVLFQKWGVRDPGSLVDVYSLVDNRHFFTNWSIYELVRDGAGDAFGSVAASSPYTGNIETGGRGEMVLGEMVTGNYFDVMGVPAERGRTFLPEEDATPGTHPVVVLADRFWRSHYGADPSLVGGQIRLNGRPYTVVGIAPASYKGRIAPGIGSDFWVPFSMYTHLTPGQSKGTGNFLITGRMKAGVPAERAQSVIGAVASRYNALHPENRHPLHLGTVPLSSILLHPDIDKQVEAMSLLLFGAVGMVLIIACVNLAGFLLARGADRRKEMAVRLAIGAGRGALVRQLLVEAVVLAGLGGGLGLALGQIFLRSLLSIDLPLPMPIHLHAGLDGRLLVFTVGVSLVAALVFGLTPALNAVRVPVASTLRDEAGASEGRFKNRARKILVATQMAVCTVLLFGAGLFVRNLRAAAGQDVGFSTAPAAVVTAETWANQYSDERQSAFVDDVVAQVSALAGVTGIAATRRLPLDLGETNVALDIPGVEPPSNANHIGVEDTEVSPGYFSVMGIPVVEGRAFDSRDGADGERVVVISRAMARRYWPEESAVGKVVYLDADPDEQAVVVGVVGDVKIWSLTEPPRPYLYAPIAQRGGYGTLHFVARGGLPAGELARRVRDAAKAVDPSVVLSDVGTMADHLGYIFFLPRMAAILLSLIGALALALGTVGLYGMVSYAAAQRTREMGIRLALGADSAGVVALVVRSGLLIVGIGGVVGLGAALALGGALRGFLIGGGGFDPVALLAAPVVLGVVALVATWLPARGVGHADPVKALRAE